MEFFFYGTFGWAPTSWFDISGTPFGLLFNLAIIGLIVYMGASMIHGAYGFYKGTVIFRIPE